MPLTLEKIEALAPDQSSIDAARKLLKPGGWPRLADDGGGLVWGECQGSGATPYRVVISESDAGYKCSCPSRKFPCKHSLALMWMRVEGKVGFAAAEVPEWVRDWVSRRRGPGTVAAPDAKEARPKASMAASQAEVGDAASDPKAEERAAAARQRNRGEREAAILAGLDELDTWLSDQVDRGVAALVAQRRRCWLVLNKIDLVPAQALLPLTATLSALAPFEQTFMVSAATGDGMEQLADALMDAMPEGPHLYPADDLTDLPDRLLAAEIVREQIFLQTHEEVPYGTTVETEDWQERKDGSVRIDATVYVARTGHKAILIGERGQRIKAIGARARAELAALLERKVHLFLNVKQRTGWDEEPALLRAIGLEDPG